MIEATAKPQWTQTQTTRCLLDEVSGHERYEREELDKYDTTKPCSGSGTDPRCISP